VEFLIEVRTIQSVHFIGKMFTGISYYPYGRGERRLVINMKESANTVDGKLVHINNISILFVLSCSAH
jgi:hypothetical protein